jgi:hypothetical protein
MKLQAKNLNGSRLDSSMLNFDDDFSEIAVLPTSGRASKVAETKYGPPKPPSSSTVVIQSPKHRD